MITQNKMEDIKKIRRAFLPTSCTTHDPRSK